MSDLFNIKKILLQPFYPTFHPETVIKYSQNYNDIKNSNDPIMRTLSLEEIKKLPTNYNNEYNNELEEIKKLKKLPTDYNNELPIYYY